MAIVLTIVTPIRNRPRQCIAQLRFLCDCGVRSQIVVADSSGGAHATEVGHAYKDIADCRYFDPVTQVVDKWDQVVRLVETPYVVMTPDDDITFRARSTHLPLDTSLNTTVTPLWNLDWSLP